MPVMKQLRIGSVNYDTVGSASVTQTLTSGTEIATVTIDGTATKLYAPSGGSSELPAVTSSDNGKVLMVVDGAWAAASIPSASGVSF